MKHDEMKDLYRALLALKTEEECASFLNDLCTEAERGALSRRLRAARLLREGMAYQDVVAETGISTATISRVSRCLKEQGGYLKVIERLEAEEHG